MVKIMVKVDGQNHGQFFNVDNQILMVKFREKRDAEARFDRTSCWRPRDAGEGGRYNRTCCWRSRVALLRV